MKNSLWEAYLSPTPKNVKKWLLAVKAVLLLAAGSGKLAEHSDFAFWILILGAGIDGLANLLTDENNENQNPS